MKEPSMEEMLKKCEEQLEEDERIVYAIGAGRIAPKLGMMKALRKAIKEIQKCDGFVGIFPVDLWHTLLVFETLNNAKGAKNVLSAKGMELGNVVPIMIPKDFRNGKDV